jgi:hypothetical protein
VLDRLTRNGRLLPRGATYVLAAVAAAFLTPDARAACGDYVHIAPAGAAAATNVSADADDALASHLPKPCHGPSCQRSPDRAPLAPVAPAPPTVEKAACSATDADLPTAGDEPVSAPLPPPLSAGRPYRPERPPRA